MNFEPVTLSGRSAEYVVLDGKRVGLLVCADGEWHYMVANRSGKKLTRTEAVASIQAVLQVFFAQVKQREAAGPRPLVLPEKPPSSR